MRSITMAAVGLLVAAPFFGSLAAQETNPTHAHLGHVVDGWRDTPGEQGFLPTAIAEAEVAVRHAQLAARDLQDLGGMKTHSLHVLHAVDADRAEQGPGHGYGVKRASEGVVNHLRMAMDHDLATSNLQSHGGHVVTSMTNTLERVEAIAGLVDRIQASTSAAQAAPLVQELQTLSEQLLAGEDRAGDGQVSWQEGEGGLNQAMQHMGFLLRGEGLDGSSS